MSTAVLGAGFIGLNYIRRAVAQGDTIRVLDHKPAPEDLVGRVQWIVGNFGCVEDLRRAIDGVDTVFHFVSSTVPGDEVDVAEELRQNVFQTIQLLDLCVEQRLSQVIFTSSSSVYGVQAELPIAETAATDPISAHGIHKLTIEKYLQLYQYHHGLDCRIVRLSNPFGPGQRVTGRQGFIAIAIGHMLSGDAMTVRGDGSTIRDFIYIDDVIDALRLVMRSPTTDRIFNVASGRGYSLNQVIAALGELTGVPISVDYAESRFVDIPASILDINRVRSISGFEPKHTLAEGLALTLAAHGIPLA